ncbi:MAG: hypothetical protein WCO04_04090 [Pseudomonadota bacterium]
MVTGLKRIAFHKSGKPRRWLRSVVFRKDRTVRKMFERVVKKKNGQVRPNFSEWVISRDSGREISILPQNAPALNRPEAFLQSVLPLENMVGIWRHRADPTSLLDTDDLLKIISTSGQKARPLGRSDLLIAVSHDNYLENIGGIQICIQREQKLAAAKGFDYLQIHPWHAIPRLAHVDEDDDVIIGLVLNGNYVGACFTSSLIKSVKDLNQIGQRGTKLVIHQLMGHLTEQIAELAQHVDGRRCVFWLHDFFSLCPSATLLRNGLRFCDAPPVTSNSCGICKYGSERIHHEQRIEAFFGAVEVDVVSPSQVTADFWQMHCALPTASISIIPHIVLEETAPDISRHEENTQRGEKIRIGYLGAQVHQKGWHIFKHLMDDPSRPPNREFVVLSSGRPQMGEDLWKEVRVSANQPDAMAAAVEQTDVDIVVHWPTCFETFSLTTYEAFAGSAYVVTNAWSGNVADAVKRTGRGVVFENEAKLIEFFNTGLIEALVDQRRKQKDGARLRLVQSDLSYAILQEK